MSFSLQAKCVFTGMDKLGGGKVGCFLQAWSWTMKAGPCRSFFCLHETPNILDFCLYQKSLPTPTHATGTYLK